MKRVFYLLLGCLSFSICFLCAFNSGHKEKQTDQFEVKVPLSDGSGKNKEIGNRYYGRLFNRIDELLNEVDEYEKTIEETYEY